MRKPLVLAGLLALPQAAFAQLSTQSAWINTTAAERQEIFKFADEYKEFLSKAKTELTSVQQARALAEKNGYEALQDNSPWRPGAKYYDINRDRTICLIVVGKNKMTAGTRIIGGHIDSPRIELKARPLYERYDFAMLQTVYHGGIKKYQWTNLPLALTGRIDKTDGKTIWIDIGHQPTDPVFIIPDLAPHVDRQYRNRTQQEVIQGEELDPIAGIVQTDAGSVEQQVMNYLQKEYGISAADFISAELALVPAIAPRDVGFDRGLVGAYGQDDRLCSYIAARASMAVSDPPYTTISYLVDNEESGSNNNTGANSDYLRGLLQRLLALETGAAAPELQLRKVLRHALALSADVTTGIHPTFPGVQEAGNAARLSRGVVIKRYGRGNDPNSEFTARFRGILERAGIPYQTHTYKVDVGGGGTIGNFMSRENMEVLDCGAPIISMHSTYSLSSKIDLWSLYRAFQAFYAQ